MKLKIKNFQIHSDLDLNIKPFTVITGPSGSGKSAVIRALKTLFYNLPAGSFVKNGTKEMSVTLEDGSDTITFLRNSSSSYDINGTKYSAIGRASLPQMEERGYAQIEIDKKKYYPQIAQQFDTPFLISFSDAEVSKLLSQLSQSGKLKVAKEAIKKHSFTLKDSIKLHLEQREVLQTKLYDVSKYTDKIPEFERISAAYSALETIKQRLERAKVQAELIRGYKSKLSVIPKKPVDPTPYITLKSVVSRGFYNVPVISGIKPKLDAIFDQKQVLLQISGLFAKIARLDQEKGIQKKIGRKIFGENLEILLDKNATVKRLQDLKEKLYNILYDNSELESELLKLKPLLDVCSSCGQPLPKDSTAQSACHGK